MKHLKHSTLVVIAILVAILGVLAQNAIGNNYYRVLDFLCFG
jgi:hypothetical protein